MGSLKPRNLCAPDGRISELAMLNAINDYIVVLEEVLNGCVPSIQALSGSTGTVQLRGACGEHAKQGMHGVLCEKAQSTSLAWRHLHHFKRAASQSSCRCSAFLQEADAPFSQSAKLALPIKLNWPFSAGEHFNTLNYCRNRSSSVLERGHSRSCTKMEPLTAGSPAYTSLTRRSPGCPLFSTYSCRK